MLKQKTTPKFKFSYIYYNFAFYLVNLIQTHRQYAGIFKTNNGFVTILPLVDALNFTAPIFFYKNIIKFFFVLTLGSITSLKFLKTNFIVCNLGLKTPQYATSRGTFLLTTKTTKSYTFFKLPSGELKKFKNNHSVIIGRNTAVKTNKQILGKASSFKNGQNRIIVRSCKKNPVDHPNGGRTRGKMLFKTP